MVLTLANMCKYDETILLNKMAEETSLLEQAFAETGVQLDRIIDAYERTQPVSNYPRYVSFVFDGDIPTILRINENLTVTPINGYSGEDGFYSKEEGNSVIIVDNYGGPEYDEDFFSYDKTTFELTDLNGGLENLQWTDLPQS